MSTHPLRLLCIPGSLRRTSWNRQLLRAIARVAPVGVHVDIYESLSAVPLFNEDLESAGDRTLSGVLALRAAVASADGLVIATPEYNHAMPGVLKNALDWLSRSSPDGEVLINRPVAVLGVSSGPWGTRLAQASLRQVLHTCGALVMPTPTLFVANAVQRFDAQGGLADPALEEFLTRFVAAFCTWVKRVAPLGQGTLE